MEGRHRETLAGRVGRLLQSTRVRHRLHQWELAELAGCTQQRVSLIERGMVDVRLGDAERLFAAAGARLLVVTGPPVDPAIDDPDLVPRADMAAELDAFVTVFRILWRQLADVPFAIAGRLAALAQGMPIRPTGADLVFAEDDVDAATSAMWILGGSARWNERHQDFTGVGVDLRQPGPRRWLLESGLELRIEVAPSLPPTARVQVGDISLPVVPLIDLLRGDPDIADLADRLPDLRWAEGRGEGG